jgi:hypothetical protein
MNTYKWDELSNKGYTKKMLSNYGATHSYIVSKPTSEDWPKDVELIAFCDGGPEANFGGRVQHNCDTAYVDVYVD